MTKRRIIIGAVVIWLVLSLGPRPVYAHAGLIRAEPADLCVSQQSTQGEECSSGPLLTEPPTAVHLWFSEPIQSVRHGLTVISPAGQRVEQGAIQNDNTEISIAVKTEELGTYQVNWQVVSGDTHPVVGHFNFSVGHTSQVAQAVNSTQVEAVAPLGLTLQVVARFLHFVGYALAFGPLLFGLFVLHPVLTKINNVEKSEILQQRLWRLVSSGIVLLLIAEPLALLGQTGSFGSAQLWDIDLAGDMLSSSFGRVLAQRLGAAILLWVLLGIMRLGIVAANYVGLGLAIMLALADGQASHAVSSGPLLLGLAANTIHLAAMGAWVGGLITLLTIWNFSFLEEQRFNIASRFGRLAGVALLWLIASGILMSYFHLSQPTDLFASDYGKTLLFKILALIGALTAASYVLLRHKTSFRYGWWLELIALLVVLVLAGLLVSLPPPA